jgi:hypothetical protein
MEPTVALNAFSGQNATSVKEVKNISSYQLNIFPNPFNPNTTIEYVVPTSAIISIVIYDILGREVVRLIDGFKNSGNYKIIWQPNNVSSGVYFCMMRSGNFLETKKIILLK